MVIRPGAAAGTEMECSVPSWVGTMERLISSRFHGRRFESDGLPLTAVGSLAMLQAVTWLEESV